MYRYLLYTLFALGIIISGCTKDEDPIIVGSRMSYDGDNNTSPFLPAGPYEAAAHFPISNIPEAEGRELVAVQFNAYEVPNEYGFIKVYASNGSNTPGVELYDQEISGEIIANQWNTHTLTTPVPIDGNGIWISFAFSHLGQQQTIGCDAGPGVSNGDWMFDGSDNRWQTFRVRTGESINWNIRGVLSN